MTNNLRDSANGTFVTLDDFSPLTLPFSCGGCSVRFPVFRGWCLRPVLARGFHRGLICFLLVSPDALWRGLRVRVRRDCVSQGSLPPQG